MALQCNANQASPTGKGLLYHSLRHNLVYTYRSLCGVDIKHKAVDAKSGVIRGPRFEMHIRNSERHLRQLITSFCPHVTITSTGGGALLIFLTYATVCWPVKFGGSR
jgi:hypothetical protein